MRKTANQKKYERALDSNRWQDTRERVILTAMGACEYCGTTGYRLEVHHERYIGRHPSDTPDKYLSAVCPRCHTVKHWTDRLRMYSAKKREILDRGEVFTEADHQRLIQEFRV